MSGMTRRAVALGIAASPAAAVTVQVSEAVTILPTPQPQHPLVWRFSLDDYCYTEEFDSREQAISYLLREGVGYVAQTRCGDYRLDVSGDDVVEMLRGNNEDQIGEGEFLDVGDDLVDDLGRMVTAAIEAWRTKHGIDTTAWMFDEVRDRVCVDEINEEERPA